jgi:hypothetical protein
MKIQKSILNNSIRPLLLSVPVMLTTAFAACSNLAGTAGNHPTVNFQSPAVGRHQTGDYLTIGPRSYNAKDQSFDRPWPFGPEFNPQ